MLIELAIVGGGAAVWSTLKRKIGEKHQDSEQNQGEDGADGNRSEADNNSNTAAPSSVQAIIGRHSLEGTRLVRDIKNAIWGEGREKLHSDLDAAEKEELTGRRQQQKKVLAYSTTAVGAVLLGTFVPVFFPLGVAATFYLERNTFKALREEFQKKHYLCYYLFSAFLFFGMLLTGNLILTAISAIICDFIVTLIKKAEANTQKHLVDVFAEQPKHVWLYKDGLEIQIAIEELHKNDLVVVHAGDVIPVDGVIEAGAGSVDQHVLTGESQLLECAEGDRVFASTLLLAGSIRVLVDAAGDQTVIASIGRILNDTQDYTTDLRTRGRAIAERMRIVELGAGAVILGLLGPGPALGVLWSSMGTGMAAFGPITVLSYLQLCAQNGILVKDGRVLEALHKIDTVVFDKTGTLTLDHLTVGAIHSLGDYPEDELLYYAAAAEHRQHHPVAKAIIDRALAQGIEQATPEDTQYRLGYGIEIQLQGKTICVGSVRFMQEAGLKLPPRLDGIRREAETRGYSLVCIGIDQAVAGVFELQPELRPEAREIIDYLRQRDLAVYIISGDSQNATRNIAETLGVDHYFAEVLPDGKSQLINQLRDEGKFVCFIGDGINDAVALKSAQVSISLKGASSAATDTAQVVFMNQSLRPLRQLFDYSNELEQTMGNNLTISMVPGFINISSIYLLHIGLVASMGICYAGTAVGLYNSVAPLVKNQSDAESGNLS